MNLHLNFGLQPPPHARAAWGARAIYDGKTVDLLHDRQDAKGEKDLLDKVLLALNTGGLARLQDLAGDRKLGTPMSRHRTEFTCGGGEVNVEACPNASGGYLYIVAWI